MNQSRIIQINVLFQIFPMSEEQERRPIDESIETVKNHDKRDKIKKFNERIVRSEKRYKNHKRGRRGRRGRRGLRFRNFLPEFKVGWSLMEDEKELYVTFLMVLIKIFEITF